MSTAALIRGTIYIPSLSRAEHWIRVSRWALYCENCNVASLEVQDSLHPLSLRNVCERVHSTAVLSSTRRNDGTDVT